MIPKEIINQISHSTDLVQLIGSKVKLKRSGNNYTGLCPFHSEKSPSFIVSPHKNMYKCFGCGASGNSISFLVNSANYTFIDAVKYLAQLNGISLAAYNQKTIRKSEQELCLEATFEFFKENLKSLPLNSLPKKLLADRNISDKAINIFDLGYAQDSWDSTIKAMERLKFNINVVTNISLVRSNEKGRKYDFFRNRIIFPIRNQLGNILGFAGRAVADEKPKYINPPETKIYHKSNVLYGLYEGLKDIRQKRRIIITEGYIDVIQMSVNGFGETVALCGTALTDGHVNLIRSLNPDQVIILLDGDSAGRNASLKTAKFLMEQDVASYVALMDEELDPGDFFLQHSQEEMEQLLKQAIESPVFIIDEAKKKSMNFNIDQRVSVVRELVEFSSQLSSAKQDFFLELVGNKFDMGKKTLSDLLLEKNKSEPFVMMPQPVNEPEQIASKINYLQAKKFFQEDLIILECLLSGKIPLDKIKELYDPILFEEKSMRNFYLRLLNLEQEGVAELEAEDLRGMFPEFRDLIDFLELESFLDKSINEIILREITFEKLTKKMFNKLQKDIKTQDFSLQKVSYKEYQKKTSLLTECLGIKQPNQ